MLKKFNFILKVMNKFLFNEFFQLKLKKNCLLQRFNGGVGALY